MKALGNVLSTSHSSILRKIAELCNKIAINSKLLTNANRLIANLKEIANIISKVNTKYFINYIIGIL
jgi:hypothetical protein